MQGVERYFSSDQISDCDYRKEKNIKGFEGVGNEKKYFTNAERERFELSVQLYIVRRFSKPLFNFTLVFCRIIFHR